MNNPPTPGELMVDAIEHAAAAVARRTGLTADERWRANTCCHIDAAGRGCERPCEYQIRERGTTLEGTADDDSYACAEHLEVMLGYKGDPLPGRAVQYLVTPIGGRKGRRA